MNLANKRICVTGGAGFLGKRIVERLHLRGYRDIFVPRFEDYDLRRVDRVRWVLEKAKPDIIIHAAAHVGGIGLNQIRPAEMFFDNAMMGMLLMDEARKFGIEKFVQIGSACEYPKSAPVPSQESDLWNGYPEETNAPYGIAKKLLLVQGQAYRKQYGFNVIHLLPTNLYGPGDNFNPETSHVVPALVKKFFDAYVFSFPEVRIWGTGRASREFLYVDDAAEAIVQATEKYDSVEPVNIGTGKSISIHDLALLIARQIKYKGDIVFDDTQPDGQPQRCLDVSKARSEFGFEATTDLETGLEETIKWYYTQGAKCGK